jgi:hypothetical protein
MMYKNIYYDNDNDIVISSIRNTQLEFLANYFAHSRLIDHEL